MIIKVILFALSCSLCTAWPILPFDPAYPIEIRKIKVSCGDDIKEVVRYNQSTQLYMAVEGLDPGCVVHWRLAIKNSNIEHYGFHVTGSIDITDSGIDDSCASSRLHITDGDIGEEGNDVTSHSFCGQDDVSFFTYQDSLNVQLTIGEAGAHGSGFNISVTPTNECGGVITDDTDVRSPEFPQLFPKNSACIWELKVPQGTQAEFECSYFKLIPPTAKNECRHYLMEVAGHGQNNYFCGESLLGPSNKRTYSAGDFILYFRSNRKAGPEGSGFSCHVTYSVDKSYAKKVLAKLLH